MNITSRSRLRAWRLAAASATILSTLAIASPTLAAGWVQQTSGTGANLNAIWFETDAFGMAVGANGTVLKTLNAGNSWQTLTPITGQILRDIVIVPGTTYVYAVGDGGKAITSTNGGTTWTLRSTSVGGTLFGLSCPTISKCWAVGVGGAITKTTDSGATWVNQTSGTSETLRGVFFMNDLLGWAVGHSGTILKTSNGGVSWVPLISGTAQTLLDISFKSASPGLAVGWGGTILKTVDGGASWSARSPGGSPDLYGVHLDTNSSIAVAVGSGGAIHATSNIGDAWTTQTISEIASTLSDVFIKSAFGSSRWIAGSNGIILRWDAGPPTTPTNLTKSTPESDTTPTFTWSASTDAEGAVVSYNLQLDANPPVSVGNVTSYTYATEISEGAHTLTLTAQDSAENISTAATLTFTIAAPADATPPTAPTNFMRTTPDSDNTPSFTWTAATDNVAVYNYEFQLNANTPFPVGNMTSYTYPILADGAYTAGIRALDEAGNRSPWTTVAFVINTATTPAADATSPSTPPTLTRTTPDSDTSPTFTWGAATDNLGVTGYEIQIDGGAAVSVGTAQDYSSPALAAGAHTFRVRARDAAGNVSSFTSLAFTIAASAPAPTPSPEPSPTPASGVAGRLVKLPCPFGADASHSCKAVYYVGADNKRHAFPNSKIYNTWYNDFLSVEVVSPDEMSLYQLGRNVTYRPGIKMVKFTTDPKVYVVSRGGVLRPIASEDAAVALFGSIWNRLIDDLSDAFFSNYSFGADVRGATDYIVGAEIGAAPNIDANF